jgi:hypothetical protein
LADIQEKRIRQCEDCKTIDMGVSECAELMLEQKPKYHKSKQTEKHKRISRCPRIASKHSEGYSRNKKLQWRIVASEIGVYIGEVTICTKVPSTPAGYMAGLVEVFRKETDPRLITP